MNQVQKGIPFAQFKVYCMSGFEYTGDVEGLGYVYWVKQRVPVDLPDDLPINTTMKRTYVTVSSLKIRRNSSSAMVYFGNNLTEEQQESNKKVESENELFVRLLGDLTVAVNTVNSLYGAVKTYQSASTVAVTLGAEYNVINKGGTVVRNPKRVTTTKGKLAAKAGNKILLVGVLLDASLVALNKQTIGDAALNTVINVGIACIGGFCPPLGAALGVTYLVFSFFNEKPSGYIETDYIKIHGTSTPQDNIKVYNPNRRRQ